MSCAASVGCPILSWQTFSAWNESELESFLIEITARIFKTPDSDGAGELIDKVLDSSGMKGTGKWTVLDAVELGVPIPVIASAVDARVLSSQKRLVAPVRSCPGRIRDRFHKRNAPSLSMRCSRGAVCQQSVFVCARSAASASLRRRETGIFRSVRLLRFGVAAASFARSFCPASKLRLIAIRSFRTCCSIRVLPPSC